MPVETISSRDVARERFMARIAEAIDYNNPNFQIEREGGTEYSERLHIQEIHDLLRDLGEADNAGPLQAELSQALEECPVLETMSQKGNFLRRLQAILDAQPEEEEDTESEESSETEGEPETELRSVNEISERLRGVVFDLKVENRTGDIVDDLVYAIENSIPPRPRDGLDEPNLQAEFRSMDHREKRLLIERLAGSDDLFRANYNNPDASDSIIIAKFWWPKLSMRMEEARLEAADEKKLKIDIEGTGSVTMEVVKRAIADCNVPPYPKAVEVYNNLRSEESRDAVIHSILGDSLDNLPMDNSGRTNIEFWPQFMDEVLRRQRLEAFQQTDIQPFLSENINENNENRNNNLHVLHELHEKGTIVLRWLNSPEAEAALPEAERLRQFREVEEQLRKVEERLTINEAAFDLADAAVFSYEARNIDSIVNPEDAGDAMKEKSSASEKINAVLGKRDRGYLYSRLNNHSNVIQIRVKLVNDLEANLNSAFDNYVRINVNEAMKDISSEVEMAEKERAAREAVEALLDYPITENPRKAELRDRIDAQLAKVNERMQNIEERLDSADEWMDHVEQIEERIPNISRSAEKTIIAMEKVLDGALSKVEHMPGTDPNKNKYLGRINEAKQRLQETKEQILANARAQFDKFNKPEDISEFTLVQVDNLLDTKDSVHRAIIKLDLSNSERDSLEKKFNARAKSLETHKDNLKLETLLIQYEATVKDFVAGTITAIPSDRGVDIEIKLESHTNYRGSKKKALEARYNGLNMIVIGIELVRNQETMVNVNRLDRVVMLDEAEALKAQVESGLGTLRATALRAEVLAEEKTQMKERLEKLSQSLEERIAELKMEEEYLQAYDACMQPPVDQIEGGSGSFGVRAIEGKVQAARQKLEEFKRSYANKTYNQGTPIYHNRLTISSYEGHLQVREQEIADKQREFQTVDEIKRRLEPLRRLFERQSQSRDDDTDDASEPIMGIDQIENVQQIDDFLRIIDDPTNGLRTKLLVDLAALNPQNQDLANLDHTLNRYRHELQRKAIELRKETKIQVISGENGFESSIENFLNQEVSASSPLGTRYNGLTDEMKEEVRRRIAQIATHRETFNRGSGEAEVSLENFQRDVFGIVIQVETEYQNDSNLRIEFVGADEVCIRNVLRREMPPLYKGLNERFLKLSNEGQERVIRDLASSMNLQVGTAPRAGHHTYMFFDRDYEAALKGVEEKEASQNMNYLLSGANNTFEKSVISQLESFRNGAVTSKQKELLRIFFEDLNEAERDAIIGGDPQEQYGSMFKRVGLTPQATDPNAEMGRFWIILENDIKIYKDRSYKVRINDALKVYNEHDDDGKKKLDRMCEEEHLKLYATRQEYKLIYDYLSERSELYEAEGIDIRTLAYLMYEKKALERIEVDDSRIPEFLRPVAKAIKRYGVRGIRHPDVQREVAIAGGVVGGTLGVFVLWKFFFTFFIDKLFVASAASASVGATALGGRK